MTEELRPGMGVDREGEPVIDPTKNVLDLVAAAIQRQDDLRDGQKELLLAYIVHVKELSALEFRLTERIRVEQKKDTKDAVDAALTAAKDAFREQATSFSAAVDKSEKATTYSIEQLGSKFEAAFEGLRRELGDVKERAATGEGGQRAFRRAQDRYQPVMLFVAGAVVSGSLALIGILVTG